MRHTMQYKYLCAIMSHHTCRWIKHFWIVVAKVRETKYMQARDSAMQQHVTIGNGCAIIEETNMQQDRG